jgi:predicted phage-related endonuclease
MIFIDAPQGSEAWLQARAGLLTGSRAADMLATIKSGEAAARRDYRIQLVTERLTGRPADQGFISAEMTWGTETEPMARAAYECATGNLARETGFIRHAELLAGCSLDGDVDGLEGIIEIKCPKSSTHIQYLLDNKVPSKYIPQITHNLWITGAKWADFISFDPRLPEHLQLFVCRVNAADLALTEYAEKACAFLDEVENLTNKLREI